MFFFFTDTFQTSPKLRHLCGKKNKATIIFDLFYIISIICGSALLRLSPTFGVSEISFTVFNMFICWYAYDGILSKKTKQKKNKKGKEDWHFYRKRFLALVSLHVQGQVVRAGETAVTHATLKRLCPGVFPVMACQLIRAGEAPLTSLPGAVVRLLTFIGKKLKNKGSQSIYIYIYLNSFNI